MADLPLGRFCWYELMTTDPGAAPAFYRAIAGWTTEGWQAENGPPYTMWVNGETPIGGVMQLPDEARAEGAPPHWLVHVSTPDLDATTAKARELGAHILMEMAVPQVGRFAVVRDPQGAVFATFQPEGDAPGHDGAPGLGAFSWHELYTDGWEDAWAFYSQLFGWEKASEFDMGDMGVYHVFGRGAHPLGGMMNRPPGAPVSAWMFYIRVSDVEAAVAKVKELGGQLLNGPMEVPGGDVVAQCMDPQGAAFAVHAVA